MRLREIVGVLVFALFVFGAITLFSSFNPYWLFTISSAVFLTQAAIFLVSLEDADTRDPKPERYPSLTIMVPAFNSGKTLKESLESILAMKYPRKFDVVVIDDASTDGTYEIAKQYPVKIIRNKRQMGKATSLNQALKMTKTELVANIDSDTYPESDVLMKMVGYFNKPRCAAVTTLIVPVRPTTFLQKVQEFEYYVAFGFWHKSIAQLKSLYVTPGPMTIYRKAALDDVGGFDEGNITEDMEVALNLQDKHWEIDCSVNGKVYTEVPGTLRGYLRQRVRWYRGKIFNGLKYKHLLFNNFYGQFGMFVFPVTFIVEFLSMVVFIGFLTINIKRFAQDAAIFLATVAHGAFRIEFNLLLDPLSWPPYLVFLVLTVLVWGYLLYTSMGFGRRKARVRDLPYIFFYLVVYSFLITTSYSLSFFNELRDSEKVW